MDIIADGVLTDVSVQSLHVDQIEFSYGETKALNGVSLSVRPGRFVALLGANGAGKSTLFSIVTGLYSAHRGGVSVLGNNLRTDTLKALAGMGVVFQRTTLDMDLTVFQNLRYAAELQGLSRKQSRQKIADAIAQHGMQDYQAKKVAALSGGQRRRVELARALLHCPSLLLLDEPTVGLDLRSRAEFVSHVKALCRAQKTGVLWATHLMDEVGIDDDVYILDKGKIVAGGLVSQLLTEHAVDNPTALFNKVVRREAS